MSVTQTSIYYTQVIAIGMAAIRPAAVFLVLPAFSQQMVPAGVRNSIFVALGVASFSVNPGGAPEASAALNLGFFAKEILIGVVIGLFFSIFLYAMETAGQIIDHSTGRSFATVVDPLGGHQTSLTGSFFGRLASYVFMVSGGFMLLVGVLMESYAIWPLSAGFPSLQSGGVKLFESQYQYLMVMAVSLAAPALCVIFAIDMCMGLINRFAQQLNVFSLSLSIKAWVSVLVVMLCVGLFIDLIIEDAAMRAEQAISFLRGLQ